MPGAKYHFAMDCLTNQTATPFVFAVKEKDEDLEEFITSTSEWKNWKKTKKNWFTDLARALVRECDKEGYKVFMYRIDDGVVELPNRYRGRIKHEIVWSPPPGVSQKRVFSTPSPSQKDQEDERGKINKLTGLLLGQGIKGKERDAIIKTRVNQGVFRDRLLEVYCGQCCITGIENKELLIASHIKPWSESKDYEKLVPENGLLLNALHDKAFDRGLITISSKGEVEVSSKVSDSMRKRLEEMLLDEIEFPHRGEANKAFCDFLAWHRKCVFKK